MKPISRDGSTPKLTLASASPRRSELLNHLGLRFDCKPADLDEAVLDGEEPIPYVIRTATAKGIRVAEQLSEPGPSRKIVLAADTTVALAGRILGKPADDKEAFDMLSSLSGEWHFVHTGIALVEAAHDNVEGSVEVDAEVLMQDVVSTEIRFRNLGENEIQRYVASGEPSGKAGAYAIQGVGATLIAEVRGCLSNVIGLPMEATLQALSQYGFPG